MADKFVTIMVSQDTKDKVKKIADENDRSMSGQIAHWAKKEKDCTDKGNNNSTPARNNGG